MKKLLFILLIPFVFMSCEMEDKKEATPSKANTEVEAKIDYSNPNFMAGSDFLSFFKVLRAQDNYDMMIQFTSSESLDEYGEDSIRDFYKESFTNMSDVELEKTKDLGGGTYNMSYINKEVATKHAISIIVKVENDTCKIVLTEPLSKGFF